MIQHVFKHDTTCFDPDKTLKIAPEDIEKEENKWDQVRLVGAS